VRQVIIKKGRVFPMEVPAPKVSPGSVLVKVVNSCISAGTELSRLQSSSRNIMQRALDQPEKVRLGLHMAREKGVMAALDKVMGRGEIGIPTGYSAAGIALAVGEGVRDIQATDRVAVAGEAIASHAEYLDVPRNLVMRIPGNLDFRSASTVALGGIALQGLRRASVQIGEFAVVFGTGIIGQLALQMLVGSGIRVIAVDLDRRRLDLAQKMGAELCLNAQDDDLEKAVLHYTNGHGADVIVFCAATNDSVALSTAFKMARKKGKLVMVGSWGRELKREDLYAKELDFLISTSYGPGRYDANYELKGVDYPYAYVRWTENRNMEEYLRLLAAGKVRVEPLINGIYPLEQVEEAFNFLRSDIHPLVVLLDYGDIPKELSHLNLQPRRIENRGSFQKKIGKHIRVGIIGAGGFAKSVHLPNMRKLRDHYEIRSICNRTGVKAQGLTQQFGAQYATTDYKEVLSDPDVDLVMICTRHNLHGQMALESIEAGKNTFVEKPLCTTEEELEKFRAFYSKAFGDQGPPLLMVGFNRRFSRYAREVKRLVSGRANPLFMHYRMNGGYIPLDHWVHSEEGGGRIIGEACHIIDLFSFLTESRIRSFGAASLRPSTGSLNSSDNKSIFLEYEDGSLATLEYFSVGSKQLSKEFLEVHFDEKSIIVDDYKYIRGYGLKVADIRAREPDKGQLDELKILARYLSGGGDQWPISWESMLETTKITFQLNKM
jgi:predicted dehydrogenase/threonine dehydrogenase-like Zn-dependent dehydrogenase